MCSYPLLPLALLALVLDNFALALALRTRPLDALHKPRTDLRMVDLGAGSAAVAALAKFKADLALLKMLMFYGLVGNSRYRVLVSARAIAF